jgi:hypothetical protein
MFLKYYFGHTIKYYETDEIYGMFWIYDKCLQNVGPRI